MKKIILGLFGCVGFLSLRYLSTKDLMDLSYIAAFALFGNLLPDKAAHLSGDLLAQNKRRASVFTNRLTVFLLLAVWLMTLLFRNFHLTFALVSVTVAIVINCYAITLHLLNRRPPFREEPFQEPNAPIG